MNKNTVWAILLIGAILVGFSLYNSKVAKEQQRVQFVRDSIEREQAMEAFLAEERKTAQEAETRVERQDVAAASNTYINSLLNRAHEGKSLFMCWKMIN